MTLERVITIVVGIGGILAMIDSAVQRYNKSTTSKYAAQRDFEHIMRNQEQFKISIKEILTENDALNGELIRLRTQMEALIAIQRER